ncbi:MAG: carboxypeptidase regulatory-like domain-containing protein, partial [Anaerolineales bacterium]|nr:carboxypeptidase regulatory-like domain-containing protein [Anaerolineales bacterium]
DAGQCINLDGAGTVEWRNIVRGNNISGCASVAIALENVFDTLIENNYINGTYEGISLINYGSAGCTVGGENNQYGDTDGDGHCRDANTNNIIRQNVVMNATSQAFMNYGADGVHYLNNSTFGGRATMIFTRPEYLKYSDAIGNITTSTLPVELRTRSNNITPSGSYTNPPSNLSPTGAALDKIVAVDIFQNSVTGSWLLDFAGNPRLAGALYDIGAYEFASVVTATSTPVPPTPTPTSTATPTSMPTFLPTEPSVSTIVNPTSINAGQVATVNVNLNNVPAAGYTSAEFACVYDPTRVEVNNIVTANLFGADPVIAISGPQNGSFIVAIADSNGSRATTSGAAFTFSARGLQEGQTSIECTARVSRGDNVLVGILSLGAANLTIGNVSIPTPAPTSAPTPLPAPVITGQVLASKQVTIRLYNADNSLAASLTANADGTFNFTAPAGTYTITATADGFLSAQG